MINVGINGFGRIGKCCFLQLLNNSNYQIRCLNSTSITINDVEDYLMHDCSHTNYNKSFTFSIISTDEFQINHHTIKIVCDRKAGNIDWRSFGCEYIIDTTGAYLTTSKCLDYNSKYVIMSSPCKDNTPTFIYGVNEDKYGGEKIVSGSSCTSNCLAPFLKVLNDNYGVKNCVFTTIHSATASQFVVDYAKSTSRITRSIINNIIPHTTGASSSVSILMPELNGKINGTSVRVPVMNCSLLDANIELEDENVKMCDIIDLLKKHPMYNVIYYISEKKLVSSDFMTTTTPCILDTNASIDMGGGKFKFMVWYDNEWSYSAQLIRLVESMYLYNVRHNQLKQIYHMKNIAIENKRVVCRLDLNVPLDNGKITDDYRITSALTTIKYILSQNPKYLLITSHFGRPKGIGYEEKYSMKFLAPVLSQHLGANITFLADGICETTLNILNTNSSGIYLLENLRFHKQETNYENMDEKDRLNNPVIQNYKNMGDVFICDAFGCVHREHMSICAIKTFGKDFGYGDLVQKEVKAIDKLINNPNLNKLAIIGGNKITDKLPIVNSLRLIQNTKVFVAGGLAKQYDEKHDNVIVMNDGYGNTDLHLPSLYINDVKFTEYNTYDIGDKSTERLCELINEADVIFWNGSLGVIEHDVYKRGSMRFIEILQNMKDKVIIMGGGETASLVEDKNKNIYVSTGGGALLEYLEKKLIQSKLLVGLDIFTE